jgi:hypothetical protein
MRTQADWRLLDTLPVRRRLLTGAILIQRESAHRPPRPDCHPPLHQPRSHHRANVRRAAGGSSAGQPAGDTERARLPGGGDSGGARVALSQSPRVTKA